jgi:mono/diheme cytochrome c family protein
MRIAWISAATALLLAACAAEEVYDPLRDYEEVDPSTVLDAPSITGVAPENQDAVNHGEYLVELLGCGACHTEGALIGEPDMSMPLAGSSIGIAYTSPFQNPKPGIVFAPNLTPDRDTGIGRWTDDEIKDAVRTGLGRHGPNRILVMPWQGYSRITEDDAWAIVAYLRSLPPIENTVPVNVPVGSETSETYVHFGVYRSKGLPTF